MIPTTISTSSRYFTRAWHTQLATSYGTIRDADLERYRLMQDGTDLCTYTKRVAWGAFIAICLTMAACLFFAAPLAITAAWLIAGIAHQFQAPLPGHTEAFALMVVYLMISIGYCIHEVRMYITRRFPRSDTKCVVTMEDVKPPSALRLMYDSWKQKTCKRVVFEQREAP